MIGNELLPKTKGCLSDTKVEDSEGRTEWRSGLEEKVHY